MIMPTATQTMNDEAICTDLLMGVKGAIKDYASSLTEAATPEIRQLLQKHLQSAISSHEQITNYMIQKGYYPVYDVRQQVQHALQNAQRTLSQLI